jgi:holin-like protein
MIGPFNLFWPKSWGARLSRITGIGLCWVMLNAFSILLVAELAGEIFHHLLSLPLPGPVIGMCCLALFWLRKPSALPNSLVSTAGMLLKNMGLLFVPAGVGVIANLDLIRVQWVPILVGLVGSTILSLLATACVMRWCSSSDQNSASAISVQVGDPVLNTQ